MTSIRFSGSTVAGAVATILSLSGIGIADAGGAPQDFDIGPQSVSTALNKFAQQNQEAVQILYTPEVVADRQTAGVRGKLTPDQALDGLLKDTGLTYATTDGGAFLVRTAQVAQVASTAPIIMAAAPAPSVPRDESRSSGIEEITVTARRREENLQQVPIAISAIGGDALEDRGVQQLKNLNAVIPNLSAMGSGNGAELVANFRVRGLPGVLTYIDGVNQVNGAGLLTMGVTEVDRIEVLRGPQGTLFGGSSLGGAIQYITKLPGDTFGARVSVTAGNRNKKDFVASVDVPLTDTFKSKFTVSSQNQDGFMRSQVANVAYGDINDDTYRADFVWTPIDSLSFRYNVNLDEVSRVGSARVVADIGEPRVFTANGTTLNANPMSQAYINAFGIRYTNANNSSGFAGGNLDEYQNRAYNGGEPGNVYTMTRHTLDATWDLNDSLRIRSIVGYKELERYLFNDYDAASEVYLSDRSPSGMHISNSQELQLIGAVGPVDWVLGGYMNHENNRIRNSTRVLPEFTCDLWAPGNQGARGVSAADASRCRANRAAALGIAATSTNAQFNAANLNGVTQTLFSAASGTNSDNMSREITESTAVFTDFTWHVTDKFTAAVGLRWSNDTSEGVTTIGGVNLASRIPAFQGNGVGVNNLFGYIEQGLPAPRAGSTYDFDAVTKRITLQYQWTPDFFTYASFADGYLPGIPGTPNPTLLAINPAGVAVGGYMRDVYNAGVREVPASVQNGKQTLDSYEFGLRADWLDGRLRTNATVFYSVWNNAPIVQTLATTYWDLNADGFAETQIDADGNGQPDVYIIPGGAIPTSAAEATLYGIELESTLRVTDALLVGLNVGYLKAEYTDPGQAALGLIPAAKAETPIASAPKVTANVNFQYEIPLSSGASLRPRLDYTYTDEYTLEPNAAFQWYQSGFGLLGARLSYDSGKNWELSVEGSNLTNEYYYTSGNLSPAEQFSHATVGQPREFSATLKFSF